MKLFENGVGRPSNETIKKRKVFICLLVVIVMVVIFGATYMLSKVNTKDIKGAAYFTKLVNIGEPTESTVDFDWYINGKKGNHDKKYAKNYTIYYSNSEGAIGNVVPNFKTVSLEKGDSWKHITGLEKNKYYILSVKFIDNGNGKNDEVINKLFTTGFYSVKYNAGSGTGIMNDQNINYLTKTALSKNTFKKSGDYKFSGWKVTKGKYTLGYDKNGKSGWYEKPYKTRYLSDKYEVLKLGKFNEIITLTAQWIPVAPSKNCYLTKDYKWIFVNKKISTDDNTLLKGIRKDIGAQKPSLCLQSAVTYAVYIMKDGKKPKYLDKCKSTRARGGQYSPKYVDMKTYYTNIMNSIKKGLPVVLHVYWDGGQHWITVTGYRRGVSPDKMTYNDLFAIDPTARAGVLQHNTIPNLVAPNMRVHSDHDMILWQSKSKACYTGEC